MKLYSKIGVASLFILAVVVINPVAAHRSDYAGAQNNSEAKQIRQEAKVKAQESRTTTEERKAAIKEKVEERKLSIRQDVCERRQDKLTSSIPRLSQGAISVKNAIDTMYDRVAGFYETGQLTVTNYDELVDVIEIAKANAETSLTSIESFEFELDCENESVAEQLDGFRTAVKDTRIELKAYRDALVALISSMRAEAAISSSDDSSDESSDTDDSTENETEVENETETESENETESESTEGVENE